jgi:hypothetical protein
MSRGVRWLILAGWLVASCSPIPVQETTPNPAQEMMPDPAQETTTLLAWGGGGR